MIYLLPDPKPFNWTNACFTAIYKLMWWTFGENAPAGHNLPPHSSGFFVLTWKFLNGTEPPSSDVQKTPATEDTIFHATKRLMGNLLTYLLTGQMSARASALEHMLLCVLRDVGVTVNFPFSCWDLFMVASVLTCWRSAGGHSSHPSCSLDTYQLLSGVLSTLRKRLCAVFMFLSLKVECL